MSHKGTVVAKEAAVLVILQMLFTYLPHTNFVFQRAPIWWADWHKILSFALLVDFLVEMEKALRQRRKREKSRQLRTLQ
jgi:hypothetical protein